MFFPRDDNRLELGGCDEQERSHDQLLKLHFALVPTGGMEYPLPRRRAKCQRSA